MHVWYSIQIDRELELEPLMHVCVCVCVSVCLAINVIAEIPKYEALSISADLVSSIALVVDLGRTLVHSLHSQG